MCPGLVNGTAVFSELMLRAFQKLLYHQVYCFLDDVVFLSETLEQALSTLKAVFDCAREAGFRIKSSKLKPLQTEANVLGVVTEDGTIIQDDSKVAAMLDMPFPSTQRQLKRFLGILGFVRSYYKNLAAVLKPLTDCLRKGKSVMRNEKTERASETVKKMMCSAPALALFDEKLQTIYECDASAYAWGGVLKQVHNGEKS